MATATTMDVGPKPFPSKPPPTRQKIEYDISSSAIVGSTTGSNYYVRILSTINRELLKPSASVALHLHSNALVDVQPPDVTYNDIGGCDIQKQEIREAVELPLTHHEFYQQIGIDTTPPFVLDRALGCNGETNALVEKQLLPLQLFRS
ncbi:26s proteasome regulatory subunit 6B [Orobanche minor]